MGGWVSSGMSERKQDVEKGSGVNTVRMLLRRPLVDAL